MAKNAASTKTLDEWHKAEVGGMVRAAVVMTVLVALDDLEEVEDS
jgi:hypothetical protein